MSMLPRPAFAGSSGRLTLPQSTPLRKPAMWHSLSAPGARRRRGPGRRQDHGPPLPRCRRERSEPAASFAEGSLELAARDQRLRSSAPPTSTPLTKTIGKVGQPVHIFSALRRRHSRK
jgi:hypothetical protein